MDNRRQYRRPSTMEPWDAPVREPLLPEPRPASKAVVLSALAALLVVTLVGTTFLVIRGLRNQGSPTTSTSLSSQATATVPSGTPTPDLSDPKNNGWTQVAPGQFADVKFAPSSPQRGYLCSQDDTTQARSVGVTTDGGQTWQIGASPAAYNECSIQVSPTNPLDVTLIADRGPGSGSPSMGAHYSTDGAKTWKAVPIPQGTLFPAGALWSGPYLYVWVGPNKESGQSGFLKVSANGGAFTSIDPNTLLSGAQNVSIGSAVATGNKVYLNIGYTGCSVGCLGIVASADGGKTWAQIPNKSNIWVAGVVGGTLYGTVMNGPTSTPVFSNDNGATWSTQTLPKLPDGHDAGPCLPAVDGVCYVAFEAFPNAGVAYLHAGAWTVIPFSTDRKVSVGFLAVSPGVSGHAARVWALGGGNAPGIYWHALP